jgi:hypothetical protein
MKYTDKIADTKARAEIKAQIEADKKARAEKAAQEKALREGQAVQPTASTSTNPATASAPSVKKEYAETRLQVTARPPFALWEILTLYQLRLSAGGSPLTVTLPSENSELLLDRNLPIISILEALRDVAEYVASQSLAYSVETVSFSTNFPRLVKFLA